MTHAPRRPANETEWAHTRGVIRYLHLKGFSQTSAKKELESVCGIAVSLGFIAKVWNDPLAKERRGGLGGGRPSIRSPKTVRKVLELTKCKSKPLKGMQKALKRCLRKDISKSTIRRILKSNGFSAFKRQKASFLKDDHVEQRLKFAQRWVGEPPSFWENVVFSDEKIWELHEAKRNKQNARVWAQSITEVPSLPAEGYPRKLHCWGAMSARGVLPMQWIQGGLDGDSYVNILETAKKEIESTFSDSDSWIVEDDNASAHTSKKATDWKRANFERHFIVGRSAAVRDHRMFHPPKLDDLWPIERLWAVTSNAVMGCSELPAGNEIDRWKSLIERIWVRIPQRTLIKLCHGVPSRLQEIINQDGHRIPPEWRSRGKPLSCTCEICEDDSPMSLASQESWDSELNGNSSDESEDSLSEF